MAPRASPRRHARPLRTRTTAVVEEAMAELSSVRTTSAVEHCTAPVPAEDAGELHSHRTPLAVAGYGSQLMIWSPYCTSAVVAVHGSAG